MISTLVVIMTFTGAGYRPAQVNTYAMPAAECAAAAKSVPHIKGWTTEAFCTPGGNPKLNPKR